jgi:hypothetical protein
MSTDKIARALWHEASLPSAYVEGQQAGRWAPAIIGQQKGLGFAKAFLYR